MKLCFRHRNTGRVECHEVEREFRFVRQIGDGNVPGSITGVWIDNEFVAYTEDANIIPGWDTRLSAEDTAALASAMTEPHPRLSHPDGGCPACGPGVQTGPFCYAHDWHNV